MTWNLLNAVQVKVQLNTGKNPCQEKDNSFEVSLGMKNGKIIHKQCKKSTCPINISALYLKNNSLM